jgi:hypothetical protein
VDNRVIELLNESPVAATLRNAFIALTFVLIRNAIQSSVILPTRST